MRYVNSFCGIQRVDRVTVPEDIVLYDENTMELVINKTKKKSVRIQLDDIAHISLQRGSRGVISGIVFTLENGEKVCASELANYNRVLDTVMRLKSNKYDGGDDSDYGDDFYL